MTMAISFSSQSNNSSFVCVLIYNGKTCCHSRTCWLKNCPNPKFFSGRVDKILTHHGKVYKYDKVINSLKCKGVFTCENSPRCEFDTGMTLWFHTVFTWMDTLFRPTWLWHPGDAILDWISKTAQAVSVLDSQGSGFMPERTAVSHLHDIGMSFPTKMKISPRYSYRGEQSHQYDLLRYKILCWYHVNQYRATRGNWSELVQEWKLHRYHVNTP